MTTVKLTYGFLSINTEEYFRKSTWEKGKSLAVSDHVRSIVEISSERKITGKCLPQTNVNNKEYDICIELNGDRKIVQANCCCKAGINGKCKHVAACIWKINNSTLTKTSKPQEWGKPSRKRSYKEGVRISELFPKKKIKEFPVDEVPESTVLNYGIDCPMLSVLKLTEDVLHPIVIRQVMDKLLDSVELVVANNKLEHTLQLILKFTNSSYSDFNFVNSLTTNESIFYDKNILMDLQNIINTAVETVSQSKSNKWFEVRRNRISSSIAHLIYRRKTKFDKLAEQLNNPAKFNGASVKYGVNMEPVARKTFIELFGTNVLEVGVVVSLINQWLCCSPDGLIEEHDGTLSLLEIKCPYSCRNIEIVNFQTNNASVKYLLVNNGIPELKRSHQYFTQIQVAMYVLEIKKCNFFVYSKKQCIHIEVKYDEKFIENCLPVLQKFYFQNYLPLVSK